MATEPTTTSQNLAMIFFYQESELPAIPRMTDYDVKFIVVVTRSCLLLNSARLSSDQSEINEVDYLSHEQRAIISVGSLLFVIAQFVVLKGEVEMTGRGRRSFLKELA